MRILGPPEINTLRPKKHLWRNKLIWNRNLQQRLIIFFFDRPGFLSIELCSTYPLTKVGSTQKEEISFYITGLTGQWSREAYLLWLIEWVWESQSWLDWRQHSCCCVLYFSGAWDWRFYLYPSCTRLWCLFSSPSLLIHPSISLCFLERDKMGLSHGGRSLSSVHTSISLGLSMCWGGRTVGRLRTLRSTKVSTSEAGLLAARNCLQVILPS